MAQTDCPAGDNGVCSYPDRVLLVTDGQLSVVTASVAEASLRGFEPRFVDELEWMSGERYDEVIDLVLDSLRAQSPRDNPFRSIGSAADLQDQVREIESHVPANSGVIVTCSCGHTWVTGS
ncbi:hypothetical protein [Intrasporangium sp. YIM S08009]|uniref:hypothetical protein n=1 Tax=Intrasporangium zincisolvens TaxID=3080018 RepID=UPI002B055940|nr:hypothetical protein [Intrasporangium sp. YIM S08009]